MGKLKNITLSAPQELLNKARKKALERNSTLNAMFRDWLESVAREPSNVEEIRDLLATLSYAKAGRKVSRDEMNER